MATAAFGEFTIHAFKDKTAHAVHLALVKGQWGAGDTVLVRVHEPLSVLDFLEQVSFNNSTSVHDALLKISKVTSGVLVLLHRNETSAELLARAVATPDAHHATQWDARSYGIGAQILRDLKVGKMRLLATPRKLPSMAGFGLEVVGYEQAPLRNKHERN